MHKRTFCMVSQGICLLDTDKVVNFRTHLNSTKVRLSQSIDFRIREYTDGEVKARRYHVLHPAMMVTRLQWYRRWRAMVVSHA